MGAKDGIGPCNAPRGQIATFGGRLTAALDVDLNAWHLIWAFPLF